MSWIPYLPKEQASPTILKLWEGSQGLVTKQIQNNLQQWAHSEKMVVNIGRFAGYLLRSTELDPKLRELAVMRTLRSVDSGYAYSHHVILGMKAGLTREQVLELDNYQTSPLYDDLQRLVIEYAQELSVKCQVSDRLFWKLQQVLSPKALINLTACVSLWSGMGRIVNVCRPMPETEPLEALSWSW